MTLAWLTQAYPTIAAAAAALVGIGVGIGKVLFDVAFLKREVTGLKKEHAEMKMEQLEMKLILRQIAKKLKISY